MHVISHYYHTHLTTKKYKTPESRDPGVFLILYFKFAVHAQGDRLHGVVLHTYKVVPLPDGGHKFMDQGVLTLNLHVHHAIFQIADPAGQSIARGNGLDKIPETNALNTALNNEILTFHNFLLS